MGREEAVEPEPEEEPGTSLSPPETKSKDGPCPEWFVVDDTAHKKGDGENDMRAVKELVVSVSKRVEGESDHEGESDIGL